MIKYLVFVLLMTATPADKQAIKAKWKALFRDNIKIKVSILSEERLVANPSKVYWRLVVSRRHLQDNLNVDLSNVTKAKFDAWKAANLQNPAHFQVAVGNDWRTVLDDAGFEAVPIPDPIP